VAETGGAAGDDRLDLIELHGKSVKRLENANGSPAGTIRSARPAAGAGVGGRPITDSRT